MKLKIEKNIPFPKKANNELTEALVSLNKGDCVLLSYQEFNKTIIYNSINSARVRIQARGLCFKTLSNETGRRIWVFKQ